MVGGVAMNRRGFLGLITKGAAAAAAAATLDPESLLWTPGAKSFFIPSNPAVKNIATTDDFIHPRTYTFDVPAYDGHVLSRIHDGTGKIEPWRGDRVHLALSGAAYRHDLARGADFSVFATVRVDGELMLVRGSELRHQMEVMRGQMLRREAAKRDWDLIRVDGE